PRTRAVRRPARRRDRHPRGGERRRRTSARGRTRLAVERRTRRSVRIGLFTDGFEHLTLDELLAWLEREVPALRDLEIGTGGYSPAAHCRLDELLADGVERSRFVGGLSARGFRLAALNVSGNPVEVERHDADLRATIELAGQLGVDRVVCMSGGPAAFSAGGWFPGIETER